MESKNDKMKSLEDAEYLKGINAKAKKISSDKQILKSMVEELQFVQVGNLEFQQHEEFTNEMYHKLQEFKRGLLIEIENL